MAKILVFQHSPFEPLGILIPLIKSRRFRIRFLNFYRQSNFVINMANYQGLIVLGGPQHPKDYNQHPHLHNELKLIEKALNHNIPVLGICLGAQLLTHVLDGNVFKLNTPEFGWHKILIKPHNNILKKIKEDLMVFQWHQYGFECPPSANLLSTNYDNLAQAFSYNNCLALQFHLEVNQPLADRWLGHIKYLESLSKHLTIKEINTIKQQTKYYIEKSQQYAIETFNHFLDFIGPQPIVFNSNHAGR